MKQNMMKFVSHWRTKCPVNQKFVTFYFDSAQSYSRNWNLTTSVKFSSRKVSIVIISVGQTYISHTTHS